MEAALDAFRSPRESTPRILDGMANPARRWLET
jgi:hypothetical protein